MSDADKYSIKELINMLVIKHAHLRLAEVKTVDREKKTCNAVCTITDMELTGTRLTAVVDSIDHRMVLYPKVGSVILVAIVDGTQQYIMIQASELDGMELNGSEFCLVKGEELKTEITKLQETVAAIVSAFKSWQVLGADGGAALKAAMTTALSGKETGNFSGILNENVKHG